MKLDRIGLFVLGFALCAGAWGCTEATQAEPTAAAQDQERPAAPATVESLPQVDTSGLDDGSRAMWVSLVNDLLSPCGQPVSVARCAKERVRCNRCVPAARYVLRLVDEGFLRSEIRDLYRLRYAPDTKVELDTDRGPVRGSPVAPIAIVEFSDFECPHCRAASPALKRIVREFDGKVRLLFRHFPLSGHAHAAQAAQAAVAAGNQGKFWEMHDLLFENQHRLERADLERYATQLELDLPRFKRDLEAEATVQRVQRDKTEGTAAGVQGTPALFVGDRQFQEPLTMLPAYLREALGE